MILLSIDFETTGLDAEKDRPIEVGAILYSTGQKKCLESAGFLVRSTVPISEEITKITGIHPAAVNKFGYGSEDALETVLDMAAQADVYVGQNVLRFDKRVFENWAARHGKTIPDKLWIDTTTDLPNTEGKHLGYMAADAGFINLFPHSALSDCQTVLKLVEGHNIDEVIARAKSPIRILKAHVGYENNAAAKKRKYKWFPDAKLWWKVVKDMDMPAETGHGEFDVSFVTDIPVEKLRYS